MRMHLHRIVRTAGLCRDLVAGLLRGAVSRAGHRRKRPRKDRCACCSVVPPTGIRTAMSTGKDFTSPTRPTDCTAEPYTLSRQILTKEGCASVPTHAKPEESQFLRLCESFAPESAAAYSASSPGRSSPSMRPSTSSNESDGEQSITLRLFSAHSRSQKKNSGRSGVPPSSRA